MQSCTSLCLFGTLGSVIQEGKDFYPIKRLCVIIISGSKFRQSSAQQKSRKVMTPHETSHLRHECLSMVRRRWISIHIVTCQVKNKVTVEDGRDPVRMLVLAVMMMWY